MFDIPTMLAKIPDEYKPMAALGIGSLMLVFLALFHGAGLHMISVQQKRSERRVLSRRPSVVAGALLFGWSVFLMLALHVVEIMIWGFVTIHTGIVKHAYDAIYYCANAYTTLGMGSLDIDKNWRNISPIIAISGLFTFAWTTSVLVDVVGSNRQLLQQLEDEREREIEMRLAFRKEEWDALKTERSEALSEREKTRMQLSGLSFFQRRKVSREERNREKEFRTTARSQIQDLRQKERQDEEKLGPGTPTVAKDKDQQ
jgi:hypothetical protein